MIDQHRGFLFLDQLEQGMTLVEHFAGWVFGQRLEADFAKVVLWRQVWDLWPRKLDRLADPACRPRSDHIRQPWCTKPIEHVMQSSNATPWCGMSGGR